MRAGRFLLLCAAAAGLSVPAAARDVRIATWNLGWHLTRAEADIWIARCGGHFAFNEATRRWEPAASGTSGWDLTWGRDAPIAWDIAAMPPCDVFQDRGDVVPVTAAAYRKRGEQIQGIIANRVTPDVVAFQEVSGDEAVREILPADAYHVCSFEGHKIQRLAFAWRRELGEAAEPCTVHEPLSLPDIPSQDRLRPGLSVGLRIDGKLVRFLTVHLKSSCVSPLEANGVDDGRGALAGTNPACTLLQKQVRPLEAWLEDRAAGSDHLVLLGDFNRNLWHEQDRLGLETVRLDGSPPTTPLGPAVKVRNLLGEINDGAPAVTRLTLVEETCEAEAAAPLCAKAKAELLDRDETRALASSRSLGCRNPVGLDHVLTSAGLRAKPGVKVPLGNMGRTRPADPTHPDPLLAVSDHCPLAVSLDIP